MRNLWTAKISQFASGRYKAEIRDHMRGVRKVGRGETPTQAYSHAEFQLIYFPNFFEESKVARDMVRREIEQLNASDADTT